MSVVDRWLIDDSSELLERRLRFTLVYTERMNAKGLDHSHGIGKGNKNMKNEPNSWGSIYTK